MQSFFVQNLPPTCEMHELLALFSNFGAVSPTSQLIANRGCAFVDLVAAGYDDDDDDDERALSRSAQIELEGGRYAVTWQAMGGNAPCSPSSSPPPLLYTVDESHLPAIRVIPPAPTALAPLLPATLPAPPLWLPLPPQPCSYSSSPTPSSLSLPPTPVITLSPKPKPPLLTPSSSERLVGGVPTRVRLPHVPPGVGDVEVRHAAAQFGKIRSLQWESPCCVFVRFEVELGRSGGVYQLAKLRQRAHVAGYAVRSVRSSVDDEDDQDDQAGSRRARRASAPELAVVVIGPVPEKFNAGPMASALAECGGGNGNGGFKVVAMSKIAAEDDDDDEDEEEEDGEAAAAAAARSCLVVFADASAAQRACEHGLRLGSSSPVMECVMATM